jgi:hypothetical protein
MKYTAFLLSFILIGLLASCEKDAEVKLPKIDPKLVVSCIISPQNDRTQVAVSSTAPIYNSNVNAYYQAIKGAIVILSDGNTSWTLPFDTLRQTYSLDSFQLKIKGNTDYTLSVSTPDGKSVEASTTVPPQNTTFTYTTYYDNTKFTDKLNGKWQDPVNSTDYYLLEISQKSSFSSSWYYYDEVYMSDEDNLGSTISATLDFGYTGSDSLFVSLSSISPEYYKFFTRVKRRGFGFDNGVFTEPLPMYTNINGGLGIFAGFNEYKVKIVR